MTSVQSGDAGNKSPRVEGIEKQKEQRGGGCVPLPDREA